MPKPTPTVAKPQSRVNRMQKQFRILRGWTITADTWSEYKGQSCIDGPGRRATIYWWPTDCKEPVDFLFHEMLHVAFRALRETPVEKVRDVEETLVRDISQILRKSGIKLPL